MYPEMGVSPNRLPGETPLRVRGLPTWRDPSLGRGFPTWRGFAMAEQIGPFQVQKPGDRDRIGRPKTDPTRRSRPRLGRAGPSPAEPGVGGSAHYTGVYLIQAEFRPSPLRFQVLFT
ncbi:hypothetical protein Taro_020895 [Colocasia esculenta]|uniref:Uncharacterized protein n=1 Tax=Colocasia esculenta TaxID=4460 RepID=A0A843V0W6_COLES|nr:hypothetical protein [Colocasia esculenta]